MPTIFARSVRRHNPGFDIIQVTDSASPRVEGVTEVVRLGAFTGQMMTFRLEGFASLKLAGRAWYFDTDMICGAPLTFAGAPTEGPVEAVCRRELQADWIFTHNFRGMDFREYTGKTMEQVYPYLACATLLEDSDFWSRCLENLRSLDPKFATWYGDQEAIRNVVKASGRPPRLLRETIYACLPECSEGVQGIQVMHYKGPRKGHMFQRAVAEGLI